jgi:pantoate--beta-alanine ligase
MRIFRERGKLHAYLGTLRRQQATIGFVPTMGALHQGHLSLIAAAAQSSDVVVCSIFVNPTQFNDPADYAKYPVRTSEDIAKLAASSAAVLFLPSVREIYGSGKPAKASYAFSGVESRWEGAFRPGHFQGVGQVMEQLLQIVEPDLLFMGEKDFQQVLIVQELIALLHLPTRLVACPTLREPDGLAMSSRNVRLSPAARSKAPLIYATLLFMRDNLRSLPFAELIKAATAQLEDAGFKVEYLTIADAGQLRPLPAAVDGPMVALAAAWLDGVRLIDNIRIPAAAGAPMPHGRRQ